MRIGIISDTHGSLTAWKQVEQKLFYNVDLVVHCGDVLYHGPRNPLPDGYDPKSLAVELNAFYKPIFIAKGNCDAEVDQLLLDYPLESPFVHLLTPRYQILAHHGHQWQPETLPAKTTTLYNLFISGHTHIPGIQKEGSRFFLNPGSPSLPKAEDQIPTAAIITNQEIVIYDIRNGAVYTRMNLDS